MSAYARNAYRTVQLDSRAESADSRDLIVMMYDAAIDAVKLAREHVLQQEPRQVSAALAKAMTIVSGLRNSLDLERGGAVAAHLDDFYKYFIRKLTGLDRTRPAELTYCEDLLGQIREAWVAISPTAAGQVSRRLFAVHT